MRRSVYSVDYISYALGSRTNLYEEFAVDRRRNRKMVGSRDCDRLAAILGGFCLLPIGQTFLGGSSAQTVTSIELLQRIKDKHSSKRRHSHSRLHRPVHYAPERTQCRTTLWPTVAGGQTGFRAGL
jgi:hypothetical protein